MKGSGVEGEKGAAEKVIRKYRLSGVEVLVLGEGVVDDVTRVFRARVPFA
jgi:16S rRNA (guanine527-N7)-methyltransferase